MPAPIAPNLQIVTLGVVDLARSVAFYTALGWQQRGDVAQGITWFRTSGSWLGLFGYADLAHDAALEVPEQGQPAYRGVTLALNLVDEAAVDAALETALDAGAVTVKAPERMEWGGYAGYFADPDGHLWEVCYNPVFPLDAHGRIEIA